MNNNYSRTTDINWGHSGQNITLPMMNSAQLTLISCRVETELSQHSQQLPSLGHKEEIGCASFLLELPQSAPSFVSGDYCYWQDC